MAMENKQPSCYIGYNYIGTNIKGKSTAPFPRKVAEKIIAEANLALAGVATHWLIPLKEPAKKESEHEKE